MISIHPPPGTGPYGVQVTREAIRRSWLVVSSIDDAQVVGAWTHGADVIVLDMEDSVHDSKKEAARERIKSAIPQAARGGAEVFVRPDIELLFADLRASILAGVTGVVLPKVSSVEQVKEAQAIIEELEQERGLPGVIELHLSLETYKGNYAAAEIIAASPRVRSIGLGRADLIMELRAEPTTGELHMMPYLLERLVAVARVGNVEPIGAWWGADSRGTVASAESTLKAAVRARRNGLKGGICQKPHQVAPLNKGFTPAAEDIERAKGILQAFEKARAQGEPRGTFDGHLVDGATARAARGVLEHAELCGARDEAKSKAKSSAK